MARIKRKPCEVEGCGNLVTHGICQEHIEAHRQAQLDALVDEMEKARRFLGLSSTWGCLDPDCPICV